MKNYEADKYNKEDIEKMLKEYLISKSKLKELESRIEKNNVKLQFDGTTYMQSADETIEELSLKSPTISETPPSRTNAISNPTERVALSYENKMKRINKIGLENREKTIKENQEYQNKANPLKEIVSKVENMLDALNNEQRIVIETYYFYEQKWDYVAKTYMEVYNNPKTIKQLQNIRDKAFDRMLEVINV